MFERLRRNYLVNFVKNSIERSISIAYDILHLETSFKQVDGSSFLPTQENDELGNYESKITRQ